MVDSCELYEWSSHRGYLSKAKKWDWLHKQFILSMFSKDSVKQRKAYLSFMAEDEDQKFTDVMNLKKLPVILGEVPFVNAIKEKFFGSKQHIEVPESKLLAPNSVDIINTVCELYGIDGALLYGSRRRSFNEARGVAIYLFRHLRGDSLIQIGKAFEILSYSTVSSVIQRFNQRMQTDRKLKKRVEVLKEILMSQGQTSFFKEYYPKE